jgi:hypothetical protein
MSEWLTPAYGKTLELRPDIDQLDALAADRDAQWARLQATTFLTDDEKRSLVGYGPKPADLAHKYSPDQPRDDIGRWTDGGGMGGKIPRDEVNPGSGEKPQQIAAPGGKKPPQTPPPNAKPEAKPPAQPPSQPTPAAPPTPLTEPASRPPTGSQPIDQPLGLEITKQ